MRKRKKATPLQIAIGAVIVALCVFAMVSGRTSRRSGSRVGYIGTELPTLWTGQYTLLNGAMKKTMEPGSGTMTIELTTESGTVSVEVKDRGGDILLLQDGPGIWQLPVTEKTTVLIRADHHRGSFRIETK